MVICRLQLINWQPPQFTVDDNPAAFHPDLVIRFARPQKPQLSSISDSDLLFPRRLANRHLDVTGLYNVTSFFSQKRHIEL